MMSLLELFCHVDDVCQAFAVQQRQCLPAHTGQARRQAGLGTSEIMTILIHFHQASYRNFKAYYEQHILKHLRREFPGAMSYARFIGLVPRVLGWLWVYALTCCGACTGVSVVDSTVLRACHPRRITRHKVFAGLAARGKSSTGWFFGFKLHLVVNDRGEIVAFHITAGNVDDRQPVPRLARHLFGKLFGDKG